jgi:hypothetical protein
MTRDLAHDLIDRLAADLEPVRPIAPLGVTLAAVLASAALVGGVILSFYDLHAELWTTFMHDRTYAGVLVGLGLAVLGGCLAALASVVPGREAVLRAGAGLVFGGLLLAVGVAAATTRWAEASFPAASADHLMCIVRGVGFGLVPAAVVLFAAARGWSARPRLTVSMALLGTGASGALLVHLTCPAIDPLHVLCTHTSTPILMAVLFTALLVPAMRRWAR